MTAKDLVVFQLQLCVMDTRGIEFRIGVYGLTCGGSWRNFAHYLSSLKCWIALFIDSSFNFDILSLNTRGIGGHKKSKKVFNFQRKHHLKNVITFLQEMNSAGNCEKIWINQWGSRNKKIYFSHGASNSTGVLTAFCEGLNYRIESTSRDLEKHFLILKL